MSDATRRPDDIPPPDPTTRTAGIHGPASGKEPGRTAPAGSPPAAPPAPGDATATGPDWSPGRTPDAAHGTPDAAHGTPGPAYGTPDPAHGTPDAAHGTPGPHHAGARLLPHETADKLAERLRHAVAGFVDAPRDAVQEADDVLRELTERFTDAVTERRRTLRRSWRTADAEDGRQAAGTHVTAADTEQLRLALRDYRELAERLLRV